MADQDAEQSGMPERHIRVARTITWVYDVPTSEYAGLGLDTEDAIRKYEESMDAGLALESMRRIQPRRVVTTTGWLTKNKEAK